MDILKYRTFEAYKCRTFEALWRQKSEIIDFGGFLSSQLSQVPDISVVKTHTTHTTDKHIDQ